MKIEMHPSVYAEVYKWTAKELDEVKIHGNIKTGLGGSIKLGGHRRKLVVDTSFPKSEVVIRCSIGELRSLMASSRSKSIDGGN
jgi:hypothetical protein